MAYWKHKIDLSDLRERYGKRELSASEFGRLLAERIRKQKWFKANEEDLEPIADEFEGVTNIEEFNAVLDTLYDWGDIVLPTPKGQFIQNKMCWIGMI